MPEGLTSTYSPCRNSHAPDKLPLVQPGLWPAGVTDAPARSVTSEHPSLPLFIAGVKIASSCTRLVALVVQVPGHERTQRVGLAELWSRPFAMRSWRAGFRHTPPGREHTGVARSPRPSPRAHEHGSGSPTSLGGQRGRPGSGSDAAGSRRRGATGGGNVPLHCQ
jgi:hypothetical protein